MLREFRKRVRLRGLRLELQRAPDEAWAVLACRDDTWDTIDVIVERSSPGERDARSSTTVQVVGNVGAVRAALAPAHVEALAVLNTQFFKSAPPAADHQRSAHRGAPTTPAVAAAMSGGLHMAGNLLLSPSRSVSMGSDFHPYGTADDEEEDDDSLFVSTAAVGLSYSLHDSIAGIEKELSEQTSVRQTVAMHIASASCRHRVDHMVVRCRCTRSSFTFNTPVLRCFTPPLSISRSAGQPWRRVWCGRPARS